MEKTKLALLPYLAILGMDFVTLRKVLRRNGFDKNPHCLGRVGCLFAVAIMNSILSRFEERDNGRDIEAARIEKHPVFIIGHWCSGTTHLHNLLSLAENWTYPTVYQTMFPRHFCYTQRRGSIVFDLLAPKIRPMDNVAFYAAAPMRRILLQQRFQPYPPNEVPFSCYGR